MREILFKAKRIYNGEWVEGYLIESFTGIYYIVKSFDHILNVLEAYEVDKDTLCQYTGLNDKNGNKIWERDILRTRKDVTYTKKLKGYYGVDSEGYPQKVPGYDGESEYQYSGKEECYAEVVFSPGNGYYLRCASVLVDAICNEVVGNIFDNPELLEGKKP